MVGVRFYTVILLLHEFPKTIAGNSSEDRAWCSSFLSSSSSSSSSSSPSRCLDFVEDFGGIPDDSSPGACQQNTELLSQALTANASQHILYLAREGRTLYFHHGVFANQLEDTILVLDGTVKLQRNWTENSFQDHLLWYNGKFRPAPFFFFQGGRNITVTTSKRIIAAAADADADDDETDASSSRSSSSSSIRGGLIDGGGPQWWGIPFIGFLQLVEQRPMLFVANGTTQLLMEGIVMQDAPFYHLQLNHVHRVEIRHISIVSRRTKWTDTSPAHGLLDLSAFNTDGIDVSGNNVWIHDVDIWTQDDCIAVKDNYGDLVANRRNVSSNMTFERITASGLGLVIGSIGGGSTVRNITFRDSYLFQSFKGIYFKFRQTTARGLGLVENVLVQNITMEAPQQWPIWIGPAQQAVARNPCHASPCSLCWPIIPLAQCNVVHESLYRNITLQNVQINNPQMSAGVLMGSDGSNEDEKEDMSTITSSTARIDGLVLDNVQVTYQLPAVQDPRTIFPGLQYPINDPFLRYGMEYVVVVILAVLVAVVVVTVLVYRRRRGGIPIPCRGMYGWSSTSSAAATYSPLVVREEDHDGDDQRTITSASTSRSSTSSSRAVGGPTTSSRTLADDQEEEGVTPDDANPHAHDMEDFLVVSHDHDHDHGIPSRGGSGGRCVGSSSSSRVVGVVVVGGGGGGIRICRRLILWVGWVWLGLLSLWWWKTLRTTHTVTDYYVCRGVSNGVARGTTWPIPNCLLDETTPPITPPPPPVEEEDRFYTSTMSWTSQGILLVLVVASLHGSIRLGYELYHTIRSSIRR